MNFSRDKNRLFENDFQARHFHSREKVSFLLLLRFPEWMAMPGQRAIKNHCITGFRSISGIGILFLFITALPFLACSQEISNVRVIPGSEQVYIHYDLAGKGQTFKVDLFYSADDGQTWKGPLKKVSGDVGTGIKSGDNKRIIWDVLTESDIAEGYLQFLIIAETSEIAVPKQEIIQASPQQQIENQSLPEENIVRDEEVYLNTLSNYGFAGLGYGISYGSSWGARLGFVAGEKLRVGLNGSIGVYKTHVQYAAGIRFYVYKEWAIIAQYGTNGFIYDSNTDDFMYLQQGASLLLGYDWFFSKHVGITWGIGGFYDTNFKNEVDFVSDGGVIFRF